MIQYIGQCQEEWKPPITLIALADQNETMARAWLAKKPDEFLRTLRAQYQMDLQRVGGLIQLISEVLTGREDAKNPKREALSSE